MQQWVKIFSLIVLPLFGLPASTNADDTPKIKGVHGSDDRRLVDSSQPPWTAIGRVNIKGYRKRHHCTGTLVASNQVITAAHCLADTATKKPFAVERIVFLAGLEKGDPHEIGHAKCVSFLHQGDLPYTSYKNDAALITLTGDMETTPIRVLENAADIGASLSHAGYAKDRPFSLAADKTCKLKSLSDGVWLTDCDTNFGASGGPLLVEEPSSLKLGAIMIGYASDQFSLALPQNEWANLLNRTQCD